MGILDGQLKAAIYQGFKGRLLTGTLRRDGMATSSALDSHGDPIDTTAETWTFEGLVDNYSRHAKAQAGIPEGDVKLLILAGSLTATPRRKDRANINGKWWEIRSVEVDPAGALYECQAFEAEAPA